MDPARLIAKLDVITSKADNSEYQVMLVDDDEKLVTAYAHHLEAVGLRPDVFTSPLEALESLESSRPDLILLDVDMPEMTGLELAALIRHKDDYDAIPIVFLSADTSIQTRLASMHLGADDYFCKPIEPDFLARAVKVRVARARSLRDGNNDLQRALRDFECVRNAMDEHAIVAVTNATGDIVYTNRKFSEISGYSADELLRQNYQILKSGLHSDDTYSELWASITRGKVWSGTLTNRNKKGCLYDVTTTIVPKLDATGLPVQYFSFQTDITAIKNLERNLAVEAEKLSLALETNSSPAPVVLLQPIINEVTRLLWSTIPSTVSIDCRINDSDLMFKPLEIPKVLNWARNQQ